MKSSKVLICIEFWGMLCDKIEDGFHSELPEKKFSCVKFLLSKSLVFWILWIGRSLYINRAMKKTSLIIRPRGKKKMFYGRERPNFPFWQIFFSSLFRFLQNLVKSAVFWPKSKNFSWQICQNIFPKFFYKKCQIFFRNFRVFRVIFATRKKKKNDRPTLLGRSIHP